MPSSSRDDDKPRRRRKEYDRDRESTSSREKQRSQQNLSSSSRSHKRRSKSKERDRERDSTRSATSDRATRKTTTVAAPEMDRRASGSDVRPKTSYPTFSKAHSREAIGSREDIAAKQGSPCTPEATEIGGDKEKRRNSTPANGINAMPNRAPPSPPLTAENPDVKRSGSAGSRGSTGTTAAEIKIETRNDRKGAESTPQTAIPGAAKSNTSLHGRFGESDVSSMPGAFPEETRRSTPNSGYHRTVSTESQSQPMSTVTQDTTSTDSRTDSDATSIAPERKAELKAARPQTVKFQREVTPPLGTDSPPTTPTRPESRHPPLPAKTPVIDVPSANAYTPQTYTTTTSSVDPKTPMTAVPAVPPPPPPPPPLVTGAQPPPRVDYLLKNGGLAGVIPKRLVAIPAPIQQYSLYQSPAVGSMAPIEEYAKIFSGLHKRLDDYLFVLRHSGSLAVATGYKSVARRLLDKLSQIFARDISSQKCDCVICKTTPQPSISDEEDSGVNWGEILEFVSGRRELPQWPPFTIQPDDSGLGISGATQAPMQKLDIDVPEEYKDHYIRQNQKTKKAVQSWLAQQPDFPSSPPEEADEDTLMFAMMTKLDAHQRNLFIALMHGQGFVSSSRAPTPAERPAVSSDALRRTRKALQRLYRLDRAPRDCESAMYLLNNPQLHGMLATLAEVNEAEWDILVSGRFDGFLWSGAEAPFPPSASAFASPSASRGPSRGPNAATPFSRNTTPFSGLSAMSTSRNQTPFSPLRNVMSPDNAFPNNGPAVFPSRGQTPAFNGMGLAPPAPVQLDEDTEIAVLAEVERNLFNDMERFEDAFEILHSRAELVRQLLRERSAGLSMQAQMRRGSGAEAVGVRLDTPASGVTDIEEEDDDGLADLASLAPDDSASQISVNRRQRKRHERRTPAPVAEEDESVFEEQQPTSGKHGGRRSKY